VLTGIPSEDQEDSVGAKFYCLHTLAMACSTFTLERRLKRYPQWCYLIHLFTTESYAICVLYQQARKKTKKYVTIQCLKKR